MARSDLPGDDIAFLLDDAVNSFRNRGFTRTDAIDQAALALGLSPRRAKAILWREPFAMAAEEYRKIRGRFRAHLEQEANHLLRRAEEAMTRAKQMDLEI